MSFSRTIPLFWHGFSTAAQMVAGAVVIILIATLGSRFMAPNVEVPHQHYAAHDLMELSDELFHNQGERFATFMQGLSSLKVDSNVDDISRAEQLLTSNSGSRYAKIAEQMKLFTAKTEKQRLFQKQLEQSLDRYNQRQASLSEKRAAQSDYLEELKKSPQALDDLRNSLQQNDKSQSEVRELMNSRAELEKERSRKLKQFKKAVKSANKELSSAEYKLDTHQRLVKTTKALLKDIQKQKELHSKKSNSNGDEMKRLQLQSEIDVLTNDLEQNGLDKDTIREQKGMRVNALELLDSLSLGSDLAATKAARSKKLHEVRLALADLKKEGPKNLDVDPDDGPASLKKVGYFAQLAHNKKVTELETMITSLESEIQFIDDFGDEDPTKLRATLITEVENFTKKMAKIEAREGQMEAKIEGAKHRFKQTESEITLKKEFQENSATKLAQYSVQEDQLKNQLSEFDEHFEIITDSVNKCKKDLANAEKNYHDFRDQKLENNVGSLQSQMKSLKGLRLKLHADIVAAIRAQESQMKAVRDIDESIQHIQSEYVVDLEDVRSRMRAHDTIANEIQALYTDLSAAFSAQKDEL